MPPKPISCAPELLSKDLSGKVFIITGASSGIGAHCAKVFVGMGATVILAGRKGTDAVAQSIGKGAVSMYLDLAEFASVKQFAAEFLSKYDRLDMLMNNAAVMMPPKSKTVDGHELQWGTNHLGHFKLTLLLKDVLEKSAPSRVVILSSASAFKCTMMCPTDPTIDYSDINWEKRKYVKDLSYGSSKLANLLTAMELPNRFKGVTAYSLHPGWVQSKLMRHMSAPPTCILKMMGLLNIEIGCHTSYHCALSDDKDLVNGAFYTQCGIYKDKTAAKGAWPLAEPPNPFISKEAAKELWDYSVTAVAD